MSYTKYDNCQFILPENSEFLTVVVNGSEGGMIDCSVEGSMIFKAGSYNAEVTNCTIDRNLHGRASSVIVRDSDIMGNVDFDNCGVAMEGCTVRGTFGIWNENDDDEIRISDCDIINLDEQRGMTIAGQALIQFCNIKTNHIGLIQREEIVFFNNTIFTDFSVEQSHELIVCQSTEGDPIIFDSNIISSDGDNIVLFDNVLGNRRAPIPEMQFNCINGFIGLAEFVPNDYELHNSNIESDPLLSDPSSGNYSLCDDSPCIDAGNPDNPPDPDGTRADIGANYFHQEVSVQNAEIPEYLHLITAYPNPFNAQTTLSFSLPRPGSVSVDVYNLSGRKVQSLGDAQFSAGQHRIIWSPQQLPSGSYFIRLSAGDEVRTNKVTLLK